MVSTILPPTHKALVLNSLTSPPSVQKLPTPQPTPGSVVVHMLAVNIPTYAREIYNGTRKYPFPLPLVIGTSGVGRIAAIGSDTTAFTPGQLVLIDSFIRARDDPTSAILMGIHQGNTAGSKTLMHGEWKDATYAEYAKVPLENCYALDEIRLLGGREEGGLGYKIEELADLSTLAVSYGGLADVAVKPGETVIVAPATGRFGSAAVKLAAAMGARVVAMGRNVEILKRLAENERVEYVPITGDIEAETAALKEFGPIDIYFDISPAAAATSSHLKSCILSLKHSGRISWMGGIGTDVGVPYGLFMHKDLMLKGKWMYSKENVKELIKMAEVGVLDLRNGAGSTTSIDTFPLENWDNAFTAAADGLGKGGVALFFP
ncbi:hypothetical protein B7494_g3075 [Chlorociboria aeruginascens]|nr:hypothetical protein B7494_g3075 [Chlorociboria aeruginascens]